MRIVFLAKAGSIHTHRWLRSISERGHDVHLITLHRTVDDAVPNSVSSSVLPFRPPFGYVLNVPFVRRVLRRLRPALLHVHFASGYGTLARLVGFHPCLLSVWGSDIQEFPSNSRLKRQLLRRNLLWADGITATSAVLREEVLRLTDSSIEVAQVPFGVDCELFKPRQESGDTSVFTVGTIKTLAPPYAISHLLRAFAVVREKAPYPCRLVIAGQGPQEAELKHLAACLEIAPYVDFVGQIPHGDVPAQLAHFDVFVALSRRESFGVAVLEASACGLPVVVSDAGGLPEVVRDGVTGYVVPVGDVGLAADRILQLAQRQELRRRMGNSGREFVLQRYEWQANVDSMIEAYANVTGAALGGVKKRVAPDRLCGTQPNSD